MLISALPGSAFAENAEGYSVTVNAAEEPETTIALEKTELTLEAGDTYQLTAVIEPSDKKVVWTSDREDVATVDSSGKIGAVASGTAIITATTEDGKKATCTVTVKAEIVTVEAEDVVTVQVNGGKSNFDLKTGQTIELNAEVSSQQGKAYHIHWTETGGHKWAHWYDGVEADSSRDHIGNPVTMLGVQASGVDKISAYAYGGATHEECDNEIHATANITVNVSPGGYEYGAQGEGRAIEMISPSDVTQLLPNEEEPDYQGYVNQINTPFEAAEPVEFTFELSGGMGQCTNESFEKYAMPYVKVKDKNGDVIAEWEDGNGDIAYKIVDRKVTITLKDPKAGEYTLLLEKDFCLLQQDYIDGRTLGKDISFNFTVNAAEEPETTIALEKTELTLEAGDTYQLTAVVEPSDKEVVWTSDREDVATVDSSGKVYGIGCGTATITVSAGDVSDTCEVTVYEMAVEIPSLPSGDVSNVTAGMTDENADSARTVLSNIVNLIIGGGNVSGINDEAKSKIIAAVEDENRTVTTEVKTEILEDGTDDITAYYINKVVKELSESINAEVKVQQYLDLGIDVLVDGSKVGSVTKLPDGETMSFTIAVPKYIRDVAKEYFIIRTHIDEKTGMESERIEHIDNGDGTLTFKTDRFSVYALAYTMGALDDEKGNGGNTGTGDDIITGDDNPSGGRDDSNAWNSGTVIYTAGQSGSPSNSVTKSFTGSQSGTQSAATGDEEAAAVLSDAGDLSGFDDADAAGGSQTDEADRNIVIPLLIAVIVAALLGITAVRAYIRRRHG